MFGFICKIIDSHNFILKKDSGCYWYLECSRCPKRKFTKYAKGYQPLDMKWLLGGDFR